WETASARPGWSALVVETFSVKIRLQPARFRASSWRSSDCSSVHTRAYPISMGFLLPAFSKPIVVVQSREIHSEKGIRESKRPDWALQWPHHCDLLETLRLRE